MKCEAQLLPTVISTQLRELNSTKQKQIKVNLTISFLLRTVLKFTYPTI